MPDPLDRFSIPARELAGLYAPRLDHPNKREVHAIACPPGALHQGTVTCSRWPGVQLPGYFSLGVCAVGGENGIFRYPPSPAGTVDWHVNFADPDVFAFYGTGLLAQDELQVAEHPALASLRECLLATDRSTRTRDGDRATPILVADVERRVLLRTDPDPAAGRPRGLYGNRFAAATAAAVRAATDPIEPASRSNIIAMAAPGYGSGRYTRDEVAGVIETAYSAFAAARAESAAIFGAQAQVVVHTGFWGCGAFGGNRTLMTILQVLAAHAAGLDAMRYYTVDAAGSADFAVAMAELDMLVQPSQREVRTGDLIDAIVDRGFEWGRSNGT